MAVICIFYCMKGIANSYMALHVIDNDILYYHMNVYMLITLAYSSFTSPDYVAIQWWIKALLLYPTNIV